MRTNLLLFIGLILGFLLILSIRPVNTSPDNWVSLNGRVAVTAESGGPGDIIIQLEGSTTQFYINRGTDHGLDVNKLNASLKGEEVVVSFANHFTPLDPFGRHRHVTRLVHRDSVIYDQVMFTDANTSLKKNALEYKSTPNSLL